MSNRSLKYFLITSTLFSAVTFYVTPVSAQSNTYYSVNSEPSVEVNLDVLENMDAPSPVYTPSAPVAINTTIETTPIAPPAGFENRNEMAPVVISSQSTATPSNEINLIPPQTSPVLTTVASPPILTTPAAPITRPVMAPIAAPTVQKQVVTTTSVETTGPRPSFLDVIEKSVDRLAGPSNTPPPVITAPVSNIPAFSEPASKYIAPQASQQLIIRPPTAAPAQPVLTQRTKQITAIETTSAPTVQSVPMIVEPIVPKIIEPTVSPQIAVAPPVKPVENLVPVKDMKIVETSPSSTISTPVQNTILSEPLNNIQSSDIDWKKAVTVTPANAPVIKSEPIEIAEIPVTTTETVSIAETPKENITKYDIDWREGVKVTPIAQAETVKTVKVDTAESLDTTATITPPAGSASAPIGREDSNQPLNLAISQAAIPPMTADDVTHIETISINELNKQEVDSAPVIQPVETVKKTRIVKLSDEDMEGDKPLATILAENPHNEPAEPVTAPEISSVKETVKKDVAEPVILNENISMAQFKSQPSIPVGRNVDKVSTVPVIATPDVNAPATAPEKVEIAGYKNMDAEVAIVKSMSGPFNYDRNPKPSSKLENITVDDLEAVNELSTDAVYNNQNLGTPPQIVISEMPNGRGPAPEFVSVKQAPEIAEPELSIAQANKVRISKDEEPQITSVTTVEKTETIETVQAAPVEEVTVTEIDLNTDTAADETIETAFFMPALNDTSLVYEGGSQDISEDLKGQISPLIDQLKQDPNARLQLRSYAQSADGSESSARRISLARAIELRKYIMSNGVAAERLDVRALGEDEATGAPVNRVDMVITP